MSKFGFICSQISQLLRLVTQVYGNERTCDNRNADDGKLICRSAECECEPLTKTVEICARIPISTHYIFTMTQHVV